MAAGQVAPADGRSSAVGPAADAWLVVAGLAALGAALLWFAHLALPRRGLLAYPLDLSVYRDAGLVVRHVRPFYQAGRASPLYDWPGPPGHSGLTFTYAPFAALPFSVMSRFSLHALGRLFTLADLVAVPSAIWITFGALGWPRGARRLGLTLLATAVALMTEPVLRGIGLGQVDIVLMVLVVWDLCQPDRRWWKGAGVGLAAGIKLVPLIFIPYLLLTRRFKQAAVAAAAFAATVIIGFIVLPRDSSRWWLHGLFIGGSYIGSTKFAGNQSLLAIVARTGSPVWHTEWLLVATATGVAGLAVAALLDRAGQRMLGLAACALTGLLISPISWDHHWVWIVLAAPVLLHYALRAHGLARWAWLGLAGLVPALFGAWPVWLWGETPQPLGWPLGLIWAPPCGDNREIGWHGFQLIVGNTYLLTGLALFVLLLVVAVTTYRNSRAKDLGPPRDLAF